MAEQVVTFREIREDRPQYEAVAAEYGRLEADLAAAPDESACAAVVARWDQLVRRLATWENLTDLHFQQDTRNQDYKQERDYLDELKPKLTDLAIRFKRQLVGSPFRRQLEQRFGHQAFALWEADLLTFDPAIEAGLVQEAKLGADYTALLASAQIPFRGGTHNLSGMVKFREDADRATRYDANRAYWQWFEDHAAELDRLYDEQVRVRDAMARQLGYDNFIGLGYKRMKRVDYAQADVERFRADVREHVVPLAVELRRRQAAQLGLDPLMYWDESVHDPRGNPVPKGDHDWMLDRAQEMFDALGPELSQFFRLMRQADLMDLKNREGKAGGGFCTDFPSYGLPYIFANFNGTKGDVEVFTHEIGHAFQGYSSRHQPLCDYLFPTYESCEIHSMGLEFLTWPQMEKFFGTDGERFRRIHLTQALLFLPYGVAVDHFQHLVYAHPTASAAERHGFWRQMEQTYLPWRDFGDLPHVGRGAFWQFQRHLYLSPFYYIDYTLAQTCALQLWARARADFPGTMRDYVALCRRGGEAPFQELAKSAGLVSPFESGCLRDAVHCARQVLLNG